MPFVDCQLEEKRLVPALVPREQKRLAPVLVPREQKRLVPVMEPAGRDGCGNSQCQSRHGNFFCAEFWM